MLIISPDGVEQSSHSNQEFRSSMSSRYGDIEVCISVKANRPLNQNDESVIGSAMETIRAEVMAETIRLNPECVKAAASERASLVEFFSDPILVDPIPNGYCSQWCCRHLPWFLVTTKAGRIKIGWRKRVISIDWADSLVKATAEDLFPDEDTTKFDRSIHACGLDKARQYVATIIAEARP